jgi:hypothetical protein
VLRLLPLLQQKAFGPDLRIAAAAAAMAVALGR